MTSLRRMRCTDTRRHTFSHQYLHEEWRPPHMVREQQLGWLTSIRWSNRPWISDISDVTYTYVDSVRANLSGSDRSYTALRRIEDTLATARSGLAFGGMMFADRASHPISPTWVCLEHGGIRPNGRAAGSGWPSHRTLDRSDVLDVGAIDGRNLEDVGWGEPTPRGFELPNANLYAGSVDEKYFEMTRIAGSISAIDLSNDGMKAALIEHWGGPEWRIAIADLESGTRRYIYAPTGYLGIEEIQYSPSNDFLLVVGGGQNKGARDLPEHLILISVDSGAIIRLPIENVVTAAWCPSQSASSIAIVRYVDDGAELACFDCATGQLTSLGPISFPNSDLSGSREYRLDHLAVHPIDNVALCPVSTCLLTFSGFRFEGRVG